MLKSFFSIGANQLVIVLAGLLLWPGPLLGNSATRIDYAGASAYLITSSDHVEVIYRHEYAWAVPQVVANAEAIIAKLASLFPKIEQTKTIIHLVDSADSAQAFARFAPRPFIRLWLAAAAEQNDYGELRLNERFKLGLAHELTHIAMGSTHKSGLPALGKVSARSELPLSYPFAVLTNAKRFAPEWFHEGAAVFLESWLLAGKGRINSHLSEAFFRAWAAENEPLPPWHSLSLHQGYEPFAQQYEYLFGARFMACLADRHGAEQVLHWIRSYAGAAGFEAHFSAIFNRPIAGLWQACFSYERQWQAEQQLKLKRSNTLDSSGLNRAAISLASRPQLDRQTGEIILLQQPKDDLAHVLKWHVYTGHSQALGRGLFKRSRVQALTAYDEQSRQLFYTTDNSADWRDLYQLDIDRGEHRLLLPNLRLSNVAFDKSSAALWAVLMRNGRSHIAHIPAPYDAVYVHAMLPLELAIREWSISPDGQWLAAIVSERGRDVLVKMQLSQLRSQGKLKYTKLSAFPGVATPAWSPDGKSIAFTAYANGVSNVFVYQILDASLTALSNDSVGLYQPLWFSAQKIVAFRLALSKGFEPLLLSTSSDKNLSAIEYLGHRLAKQQPQLAVLALADEPKSLTPKTVLQSPYQAGKNIRLNAITPFIGRHAEDHFIGASMAWSDPLEHHNVQATMAYAAANELSFDLQYQYKDTHRAAIAYQPAKTQNFVNRRQSTFSGVALSLSRRTWQQFDDQAIRFWDLGADYLVDSKQAAISLGYQAQSTLNSPGSFASFTKGWQRELEASIFTNLQTNKLDARLVATARYFDAWLKPNNRWGVSISAGGYANKSAQSGIEGFNFSGFPNDYWGEQNAEQFRHYAVLPGLSSSINQPLLARYFVRLQLENRFPPLLIGKSLWGQQLQYLSLTALASYLNSDAEHGDSHANKQLGQLYSLAAQLNLHLQHYYQIQSSLSLGFGQVWDSSLRSYDSAGFISWQFDSF